MNKNNPVLIVIIVLLVLSTGLFFYKYQQQRSLVSEKSSQLGAVANFYEYFYDYNNQVDSINEVLDGINISLDYTSCMSWVSKYGELHTKYNEEEKKEIAYLQSISVNEECNNAINKENSLIGAVKEARDNWRAKEEKWCYGWHKIGYTTTWTEEYWTPLNTAFDEMTTKQTEIADAFTAAELTCLKQISRN